MLDHLDLFFHGSFELARSIDESWFIWMIKHLHQYNITKMIYEIKIRSIGLDRSWTIPFSINWTSSLHLTFHSPNWHSKFSCISYFIWNKWMIEHKEGKLAFSCMCSLKWTIHSAPLSESFNWIRQLYEIVVFLWYIDASNTKIIIEKYQRKLCYKYRRE